MRQLLASTAIIGLIAVSSVGLAQDREHHDRGGQGEQHGGPQGGQPHNGPGPQPRGEPQGGPGPRPAMQAAPERGGPPGGGEMRRDMRGPQEARPEPNRAGPNRPAPNMAMRPNQPPPENAMRGPAFQPNAPRNAPANAMRGPDRRFGPGNAMRGQDRNFSNVPNFHQNFRAEQRFRAGRYVRPRGFYEHRWSWGETLPPLFWARQYWLMDYEAYDLPPPPYGAVWVRVGGDALLIDQYDGTIIEVDYGVFY